MCHDYNKENQREKRIKKRRMKPKKNPKESEQTFVMYPNIENGVLY